MTTAEPPEAVQQRLREITSEIEGRFSEVVEVDGPSVSRDGTRFRVGTFAAGFPLRENEEPRVFRKTAFEALDECDSRLQEVFSGHSGTLFWRMRPRAMRFPDSIDGDERWVIAFRCAFGDSPEGSEG
jgi:hypothetical protein